MKQTLSRRLEKLLKEIHNVDRHSSDNDLILIRSREDLIKHLSTSRYNTEKLCTLIGLDVNEVNKWEKSLFNNMYVDKIIDYAEANGFNLVLSKSDTIHCYLENLDNDLLQLAMTQEIEKVRSFIIALYQLLLDFITRAKKSEFIIADFIRCNELEGKSVHLLFTSALINMEKDYLSDSFKIAFGEDELNNLVQKMKSFYSMLVDSLNSKEDRKIKFIYENMMDKEIIKITERYLESQKTANDFEELLSEIKNVRSEQAEAINIDPTLAAKSAVHHVSLIKNIEKRKALVNLMDDCFGLNVNK